MELAVLEVLPDSISTKQELILLVQRQSSAIYGGVEVVLLTHGLEQLISRTRLTCCVRLQIAGLDQVLHNAIVSGLRQDLSITEIIETGVADVSPRRVSSMEVNREHDGGRTHI